MKKQSTVEEGNKRREHLSSVKGSVSGSDIISVMIKMVWRGLEGAER